MLINHDDARYGILLIWRSRVASFFYHVGRISFCVIIANCATGRERREKS